MRKAFSPLAHDTVRFAYRHHKAAPTPEFQTFTPHTLRHTFATRCFENGMMPKTLQELLGHTSLNMTMDLYTHVTEEMKQKEIKKMVAIKSAPTGIDLG